MTSDPALRPTDLVDCDHPAVRDFVSDHGAGGDHRERAVSLYYAVRDGFRYDPYRIDLSATGMKASTVIELGYGWCVPKATLLAACCRAAGIPARLGYADVRNHLSTERLRRTIGSDVYRWHGYTEIWCDGAWHKATPAFNKEMCEAFGLHTLEFDGREDSIYHPYDRAGNRHMEYVKQRGSFDDVPLAALTRDLIAHYPRWLESSTTAGDWLDDVRRENAVAHRPR